MYFLFSKRNNSIFDRLFTNILLRKSPLLLLLSPHLPPPHSNLLVFLGKALPSVSHIYHQLYSRVLAESSHNTAAVRRRQEKHLSVSQSVEASVRIDPKVKHLKFIVVPEPQAGRLTVPPALRQSPEKLKNDK